MERNLKANEKDYHYRLTTQNKDSSIMVMIIIINKLKKEGIHMPLTMVTIGEEKVIMDFKGKEEVKRHLKDLGFIKGQSIRVLGTNTSGIILLVKGVRVALNKGLATKIMVA